MCALSQQRLQTIEDILYANLDFFKIFRLVSGLFWRCFVQPFLNISIPLFERIYYKWCVSQNPFLSFCSYSCHLFGGKCSPSFRGMVTELICYSLPLLWNPLKALSVFERASPTSCLGSVEFVSFIADCFIILNWFNTCNKVLVESWSVEDGCMWVQVHHCLIHRRSDVLFNISLWTTWREINERSFRMKSSFGKLCFYKMAFKNTQLHQTDVGLK